MSSHLLKLVLFSSFQEWKSWFLSMIFMTDRKFYRVTNFWFGKLWDARPHSLWHCVSHCLQLSTYCAVISFSFKIFPWCCWLQCFWHEGRLLWQSFYVRKELLYGLWIQLKLNHLVNEKRQSWSGWDVAAVCMWYVCVCFTEELVVTHADKVFTLFNLNGLKWDNLWEKLTKFIQNQCFSIYLENSTENILFFFVLYLLHTKELVAGVSAFCHENEEVQTTTVNYSWPQYQASRFLSCILKSTITHTLRKLAV